MLKESIKLREPALNPLHELLMPESGHPELPGSSVQVEGPGGTQGMQQFPMSHAGREAE